MGVRDSQFISFFLFFLHRIFLSPFVISLYLTCSEFSSVAAGPQTTNSAHLLVHSLYLGHQLQVDDQIFMEGAHIIL